MSEEQQQMDQEAKVGHLFADGLLNRADSDDSSLSDLDESGQLEKNLHEEQLKNARMETEKAELKAENIRLQAEVKMMKMQKQMDEMKASNSEKLQQAQRRIAQLEVEKAYNELMSAQVRGLQKQLMQEKQEKATSYNAVYFRLMAAKQEKEELRNEFREKIQQQADKLAEHSIELSDLKKKERLNEWLSGIVLIRTGTFLRVAVNQHLDTSGHWSIHAGGLIAKKIAGKWAHVHADQPFPVPHAGPEDKLLYYFEVTITEMNGWCQDEAKTNRVAIGLCGTDFPFNSMNAFVDGSFAIQENGIYYASGTAKRHFGGFDKGDVVGCGLLVLPTGRRLFFTKNGDLWVKPILLGADEAKTNLHPIVSACGPGVEVEFNFGADLGAKPFKYELSQLDQVDT